MTKQGLGLSLLLAAFVLLPGAHAIAKKGGEEVRNELPPSGKGSSIDDRKAREDSRDDNRGTSDRNSRGKSEDEDASGGREGSSGNHGWGKSSRVVISDDDRL